MGNWSTIGGVESDIYYSVLVYFNLPLLEKYDTTGIN